MAKAKKHNKAKMRAKRLKRQINAEKRAEEQGGINITVDVNPTAKLSL